MNNEIKRIAKKRTDILNALRRAGSEGVTNAELSKIALRYGGHLGKLYEQGYKINKEFLGDGLYKYTLQYEPENEKVRQKAIDKLLLEISKKGKVNRDEFVDILSSTGISVKYKANTYKEIV